ncbi:hypothetical protein GCM10010191_81270 [Actinomadura vinacea]|uniref:ABC transporter permease n=1 Tax=Actinomadura vinacea TaxID=115336 RepID=A0ABN3K9V0_9ACTN
MPPADQAKPSGADTSATRAKKKKKGFDADAELSTAYGCLAPSFFAHVLGTVFVLSPLEWSGVGATLSALGALVVFMAVVGSDFQKFKPGAAAFTKARRLASFLVWYGIATFGWSLGVLCVRDSEGSLWNAIFSAGITGGGLYMRGSLMGSNRAIAPPLANVLTLVIPVLLAGNAVAFMTYPGVTRAAVVLSLAVLGLLIVCLTCNTYRTPALLNIALVAIALLFFATNNNDRSSRAVWLTIAGEQQTCRLIPDKWESGGFNALSKTDYYLCPGEVLEHEATTRNPAHPTDVRMVWDRTRWTTAILKPGEVNAGTAALWLVHLGVVVVLLAAVLGFALVRRGTPSG